MRRIVVAGILGVALLVSGTGCAGWSRGERGAAIGGVAGAGLGALIGSTAGSWAWGGVIGAGAGILAGYLIAEATGPDEPSRGPVLTHASAEERRRQEADGYFLQARHARTASESEYYLKRSIELHPTAAAYNNLGLVYFQSGDRRRAEEMWRIALELDPAFQPASENLEKAGG